MVVRILEEISERIFKRILEKKIHKLNWKFYEIGYENLLRVEKKICFFGNIIRVSALPTYVITN